MLVDRIEDGRAVGRARFDAPEIDCIVHLLQDIPPGLVVKARVVESDLFDLLADANPQVVNGDYV